MYPWGWGELEGIAYRTDFDLKAHAEHSGQDLTYFDQEGDPLAGTQKVTALKVSLFPILPSVTWNFKF
jgi:glycyl-tRNA synthetase (class II)